MSSSEIVTTIKELKELRRMQEDLNAEITALEDALKAHMLEAETDSIQTSEYKVTWKEVTSSRLDTTAIKAALPDITQRFMKATTTRRLIVA